MRQGTFIRLLAVALLLGSSASAGAAADAALFRPPMTTEGGLGLDSANGLYPGQLAVSAYFGYVREPVVWRYDDGTYDPVVRRQLMLDLVMAAGVMRLVDVAVAVPIALEQRGPRGAGFGQMSGSGLGDVRVIPRLTLAYERSFGFGLALLSEIDFPTGDADRFLGEQSLSWRPRAVASLPLGDAHLYATAGYLLRRQVTLSDAFDPATPDVELGNQFLLGTAAELPLWRWRVPLTLVAELEATGATQATWASEARGGVRVRLFDFDLTVAAGAGLSDGLGAPRLRLIAGLSYAPLPPDADNDGIPDAADECRYEPEDYDRFADTDGCPEPDNDGDRVMDVDDRCPNDAEDPHEPPPHDGCPGKFVDSDPDHDGIPSSVDRCPDEPEDKDGVDDADGCPDLDDDHDGVPNDQDRCPNERETINGVADEDGCADFGDGLTLYVEDVRIEIKQTILFETGKATIKAESKPLLNQVALQILAHPEIVRIRVEGHTDDRGDANENLLLSQDRSDAVRRYLIKKGVHKDLLEALGFGESRPIDTNDSEDGRARNRRVEFVIIKSRRP